MMDVSAHYRHDIPRTIIIINITVSGKYFIASCETIFPECMDILLQLLNGIF